MTAPPPQPAPRKLLRIFGTAFGLAIVIGGTIGGGILRTPGDIAAYLPNGWLFMGVWALGGVSALLGATIFSELGAMIPRSGGFYTFAHRAFGDGMGFFLGYADWLNWSVASAGLILLIGEYLGDVVPALAGHPTIIGFLVLAGIVVMQWRSVRWGGRAQEITSALKALALIGLVIVAFLLPHIVAAPATAPAAVPHGLPLLLAIGLAMQGVIFTYDSYYAVVYCSEELTDPGTQIPRSIFRGLWLIIVIYLLVNLAFLKVLPLESIAHNDFVGAAVAEALFGPKGDLVIRGIMLVSLIGTVNAQVIATPRILHAMAEDGLFPRLATRVNKGGTPGIALWVSVAAIAAFLFSGSFMAAINIDSVFIGTGYAVMFTGFFVLRRKEPDTPRPYRAWGYPWAQIAALLVVVGFLATIAVGDVKSTLITLALLIASWPASRLARRLMGKSAGPAT